MEAFLKMKEVWDVVENGTGMSTKLETEDESKMKSSSPSQSSNQVQLGNKDKEMKNSIQAYAWLILSLRDKQLDLVARVRSGDAKGVWDTLEKTYSRLKGTDTLSSLLTQIERINIQKKESVSDYLARAYRLVHDLQVQGQALTDAMIKRYIINGLKDQDEWKESMTVLTIQDALTTTTPITMDAIEKLLIGEENKRKLVKEIQDGNGKPLDKDTHAYMSHDGNKKKMLCFTCNKPGHKSINCWFNKDSKYYRGDSYKAENFKVSPTNCEW